jgi:hypothetical protein
LKIDAKLRKGDYGIRVNVNHTSTGFVKYRIDDGEERPLINNKYFILYAADTNTTGLHIVRFASYSDSVVDTGFKTASPDSFKYLVLEEVAV